MLIYTDQEGKAYSKTGARFSEQNPIVLPYGAKLELMFQIVTGAADADPTNWLALPFTASDIQGAQIAADNDFTDRYVASVKTSGSGTTLEVTTDKTITDVNSSGTLWLAGVAKTYTAIAAISGGIQFTLSASATFAAGDRVEFNQALLIYSSTYTVTPGIGRFVFSPEVYGRRLATLLTYSNTETVKCKGLEFRVLGTGGSILYSVIIPCLIRNTLFPIGVNLTSTSVSSVTLVGTANGVSTYTVTLADGTTSTLQISEPLAARVTALEAIADEVGSPSSGSGSDSGSSSGSSSSGSSSSGSSSSGSSSSGGAA